MFAYIFVAFVFQNSCFTMYCTVLRFCEWLYFLRVVLFISFGKTFRDSNNTNTCVWH